MITSGLSFSASRKGSVPIWPTMRLARPTLSSVSGASGPHGVTLPSRIRRLTYSLSMSAAIVVMLKLRERCLATRATAASVFSRCGSAPDDPAEPMMTGMPSSRPATSTSSRSRSIMSIEDSVLPDPR